MATIQDVALLAKVSTATVSRVMRQPETVKDATKERVLEAIKLLDYKPNILARHLRRMETRTIIVVVPDITNPFFSEVLLGIESIAQEKGYQLLLGNTQKDANREYQYLDLLKQKKADGIILLTARMKKQIIEELAEQFPVVLACEYIEGSNIPTVSIDNIISAKKMTEHLLRLGHQRIGYLSGSMDIILSRDRLRGFKQCMSEHGLRTESILIQEGDFTYSTGYNLMLKLLALEDPPTAVFAGNDEMAIGAIKAIKKLGLNVPKDITVVGFDGIQLGTIVQPRLTTIVQPMFEMGVQAMQLLLKQLEGERVTQSTIVLQGKLLVRNSCGSV